MAVQDSTTKAILNWVFRVGTWTYTALFIPGVIFLYGLRSDIDITQSKAEELKKTVVTLEAKVDKMEDDANKDRISMARMDEKIQSIHELVQEIRRIIRP